MLPWAIAALLLAAGAGAWTSARRFPSWPTWGRHAGCPVDATANTTAPAPSPPAPPVIAAGSNGSAAGDRCSERHGRDRRHHAAGGRWRCRGGQCAGRAEVDHGAAATAPSATATADSVAAAPGETTLRSNPRASRVDALKDLAAARAAQDAPSACALARILRNQERLVALQTA